MKTVVDDETHKALMFELGAALSSDKNIVSDCCVQVSGHDELSPKESASVEEEFIEETDDDDESISNSPRTGWEKVKLIPLVTWFIRMLSFGLTKT